MNKILEEILSVKDSGCTFIEAIIDVSEKHNIDIEDIAEIIREEQAFLRIVENECSELNLLKDIKVNEESLDDIF